MIWPHLNFNSNSSSDFPFVSGIRKITHNSCRTIINAKKEKMAAGPTRTAIMGKTVVIMAASIQCAEAPRDCPYARTLLGNISEINTQITAPWPTACEAMNIKSSVGTIMPPK